MPEIDIDILAARLDDSLADLETCRRTHAFDWLQPILRRRRRAVATVRRLSHGVPRPAPRPGFPRGIEAALAALAARERALLAVYDAALLRMPGPVRAALQDQRDEAEQALLEITAAAEARRTELPGAAPGRA